MSPLEIGTAAPSLTSANSPPNKPPRHRVRAPPADSDALAPPPKKRVDGRGRHPNSQANLKRGGNPENLIRYRRNTLDALLAMGNHEPRDLDTPQTTRNRNRVVAETESENGQVHERDAAENEQRAGDEDATQDRSVEGDEGQGEQSGPSKKRRRENKTADRYQAAQERYQRSQVPSGDPVAGAAAYRRGLLNLRTLFSERAIRDEGFGVLFIAHPHVHGPPNSRPQIPYFIEHHSPLFASTTTDPAACLPPALVRDAADRLRNLAGRDEPVTFPELYSHMRELFRLMVKHQQEAVIAADTRRNKQAMEELARAQQRAANAQRQAEEAEERQRQSEQRLKALKVQNEEANEQNARILETLVEVFRVNGMSESDARTAALEAVARTSPQ